MRHKVIVWMVAAALAVVAAIVWLVPPGAARPDAERVALSGTIAAEGCSRKGPLVVVEIRNGSSATLKSVHFRVSLHERGDSKDVAIGMDNLASTVILAPGERAQTCFALNPYRDWDDHVAVVTKLYADFYERGETIPR